MTATLMESGTMTHSAQPPRIGTGFLLVVTGPSGAGKGTLVRSSAEAAPRLRVLGVRHDTAAAQHGAGRPRLRLPRARRVRSARRAGLLPRDGREVHGHLYGTPVAAVDAHVREGKWSCSTSTCRAAPACAACGPRRVTVFVYPPSLDALRARLEVARHRCARGHRGAAAQRAAASWRRCASTTT